MNKNILYIASVLLGGIVVSCENRDAVTAALPFAPGSISFVVEDYVSEDGSRSDINSSGQFSWTSGDTLGIFPESGYQTAFPISEGTGTSSALFDGGQWALRPSTRYAAYFPFMHPMDQVRKEAIPVNYVGQRQDGNNSTAHLAKYDYIATSFTEVSQSGNTLFQLKHLGEIARFQLTMPKADDYRKLILSTTDLVFTTEGSFCLSDNDPAINAVTSSYSVSMDMDHISTTDEGQSITLYMILAPVNLQSLTLNVYVMGSSDIYSATIEGKNMLAGKAYSYTSNCVADDSSDTHEYVDLGLPSGTLWATCNLGASYPEEYGDYYAWGEITPQSSMQYSWSSYKWCNGTYTSLTKYCDDSAYGVEDNRLRLESADDAATYNWGPAWQVPTLTQLQELYNSSYTTTSGYELNGVYGRMITSKSNGNSIFLPAAGYAADGACRDVRSYGFYMSSDIHTTYSYYGCYLYFYSKGIDWGYSGRNIGRSVRPVRSAR